MKSSSEAVIQNILVSESSNQAVSNYEKLYTADYRGFIDTKDGLNYLRWAKALKSAKIEDPDCFWDFGDPVFYQDGTCMVICNFYATGVKTICHLPVMHRAKITNPNGKGYMGIVAKPNPSAMDISNTQMRCLTKAIAMGMGIGLHLYAGETLAYEEDAPQAEVIHKPLSAEFDSKPKVDLATMVEDIPQTEPGESAHKNAAWIPAAKSKQSAKMLMDACTTIEACNNLKTKLLEKIVKMENQSLANKKADELQVAYENRLQELGG